jgi:tetratricopeptide (TPR) repeat protein
MLMCRTDHLWEGCTMCGSRVSANLGLRLAAALALLGGVGLSAADNADKDRRLLARLEDIRLLKANVKDGRFDSAGADAAYREAFRTCGIDVDKLTVDQVAGLIRKSSMRVALAVSLDDWAGVAWHLQKKDLHRRLLQVARVADPDPWRNRLRDALQTRESKVLRQLAARADLADQHPITVVLLADALVTAGDAAGAVAVLRPAQLRHPADFWINFQLAYSLSHLGPPRWQEAVRFYSAARALRPQNPAVLVNLAFALHKSGQHAEAVAALRQAIQLQPDYAEAYLNLGRVLHEQAKLDEAIAALRRAIELKPTLAVAYRNLGDALMQQGKLEEAVAAFRATSRLEPQDARAHLALGNAMRDKGALDEAIACYREAIRLEPMLVGAFSKLGRALADKGLLDEAIAAFREALRVDPPDHRSVEAMIGLGRVLAKKAMFKEAAATFRKILAVDPHNAEARIALAGAERLLGMPHLEKKLSAFLTGEFRPGNNDERLGLAEWCRIKMHHGAAAKLYADAFAAEPKLAEDLNNRYRYEAARAAVLAGSGTGEDAAKLDDKERIRWRKQAVAWLRADLAAWVKHLESGKPKERDHVSALLQYWQLDPALAGIRGPQALARLPGNEQEACRQLWADVAALQKRAAAKE